MRAWAAAHPYQVMAVAYVLAAVILYAFPVKTASRTHEEPP